MKKAILFDLDGTLWHTSDVILVYDIICDEKGRKILPKVFKICKKYLVHIPVSYTHLDVYKRQAYLCNK